MADDLLRIYSPEECGHDGYPFAWHGLQDFVLRLEADVWVRPEPARTNVESPAIKEVVREQAGHRCVRCGHPYPPGIAAMCPRGEWTPCDEKCQHPGPALYTDGENFEATLPFVQVSIQEVREQGYEVRAQWRILTVHHLNGVKYDCRWWNLVALCQRCHLTIQGKVLMENVWGYEHSEWFKPYAAGWYAWRYLGEELARDETEARLEELLALEYQGTQEEIWPRHGARPV